MFHKRFFNLFSKYLTSSTRFKNNVSFQKEKAPDLIGNTMNSVRVSSIEDWKNVRQAIINHEYNRGQYTNKNIDAVILGHCTHVKNYDLGSSYIKFLNQENIKPNLATTSRYLKLLYYNNERCLINGKPCPKDQEELILKWFSDLREEYPILDSFTLENAVSALSVTSQWKKCLELMKEIKITSVPNNASYSALIGAAFLNKEEEVAWQLLNEMFENTRYPQSICFLSYLGMIQRMRNKEKIIAKLEMLFSFFQENNSKCDVDTAQALSDLGRKFGFQNYFTSVTYQGVCKNCRTKLQKFDLGEKEFEELKSNVFKNVIVGKDVFVKTDPEELQRFTEFVQKMDKFDVVLDGLNVAYSAGTRQPPEILSAMVASVVSHFVNQGKKVLVLGRAHMSRWPRKNWNYITDNATVFLTQNISQDDPYLLYCALNSGKDTIIVTRDLMRGHKFLLKNFKDKVLFDRWLLQRQYQLLRVNEEQKPIFRIPHPFSVVAQKNGNTWHIPFVDDSTENKNQFHKTWLCFKFS